MRWGEWGVTTNRYGVSLGDNENVLEVDHGDGCTTANILKTELYTLKGEFYGMWIISQFKK